MCPTSFLSKSSSHSSKGWLYDDMLDYQLNLLSFDPKSCFPHPFLKLGGKYFELCIL